VCRRCGSIFIFIIVAYMYEMAGVFSCRGSIGVLRHFRPLRASFIPCAPFYSRFLRAVEGFLFPFVFHSPEGLDVFDVAVRDGSSSLFGCDFHKNLWVTGPRNIHYRIRWILLVTIFILFSDGILCLRVDCGSFCFGG